MHIIIIQLKGSFNDLSSQSLFFLTYNIFLAAFFETLILDFRCEIEGKNKVLAVFQHQIMAKTALVLNTAVGQEIYVLQKYSNNNNKKIKESAPSIKNMQ